MSEKSIAGAEMSNTKCNKLRWKIPDSRLSSSLHQFMDESWNYLDSEHMKMLS